MASSLNLRLFLAATATALVTAGAASAEVLYENPDSGFGLNSTPIAHQAGHSYFGADSFTLDTAATVTGVSFTSWTHSDDYITSVFWGIVDESGVSTVLANGTAAVSATFQTVNFYALDIDKNTFTIPDLKLGAGTYWLYLSDAVTAKGDFASWDDTSAGSSLFANNSGRTYGNTFSILGEKMVRSPGGDGGGGGPCNTNLPLGCGGSPGGVPEPETWALMLTGFGLIGAALRQRRAAAFPVT